MKIFRSVSLLLAVLVLAAPAWALEDYRPVVLQSAAGATGNGSAIDTAAWTSVALQVVISNTATVTFEGTADGSNWVSAVCTSIASTSGALVTSATSSGLYQCNVAGLSQFRARVSAWTSGTVTVKGRLTTAMVKKGGGASGAATSFDQLTGGTNGAELVVGDGGSLATSGSGTIAATSAATATALAANGANCSAGQFPLGVDASGAVESCTALPTTIAGTNNEISASASTGAVTLSLPSAIDLGGKSLEIPNSGTLPGTCTVGQIYMDTDATSGQRLYACESSNTWALQGDGGGGSGDVATDTIWDAAGDLVYGTGSNTASRLAAGTASQVLQMNSGATAPEWTSTPTFSSVTVTGGGVGKITLTEGTCTAGASANQHGVCVDSTTNRLASYENAGSQVNYVASGDNIGAATATTPSANDNDTSVATTAYVQTELAAYAADSKTLTNTTLDTEGAGNVITTPRRIWFPAAGCNNATAGSVWDLPTSNPAVAACVTGTNTQKGVLEFADSASLSAQVTYKLPSTWTGTVDANIKWVTTATSGNIVWQLATICVADAETDDPAFNTASTVTDAAKGTTLQTNDAAITTVTVTGCAAGELMHVKILRDAAHASDTLAATARLIGVELVIREAL